MKRSLLLALAAVASLSACSNKEDVAVTPKPAAAAPASAAPAGHPPMAAAAATNSGKALQIIQSAGYTYAEVDLGGGEKVWLAGGAIDAKAGDTLQWGDYSPMQNFTAKSLNRTFEQILFVDSWGAGNAPTQSSALPAAHPPVPPVLNQANAAGGLPPQHPPMPQMPQQAAAAGHQGDVKSVATAGGYTYLEVVEGGAPVWLAVAETPVKVGDKVSWEGGSVMRNFNAKSLGRTFDQIVFAGGVTVVK